MTNVTIKVRVKPTSRTVRMENFEALPKGGLKDQFLGIDSQSKKAWLYPPAGSVGDYDPGDINLIFENRLI